ncbi:MAG: TetR/AcrR family transcriptional regulator [Hyphomicrobiales bacterium]|nr:MAG: TetR/AcrR family transcriptional regulator [Hyphomicrobiales bacterium]
MARPRADDYDDKRDAILDVSGKLFAERGYDGASMNQIAVVCGVSKALLYHYYANKEALLFDIIERHLQSLIEGCSKAAQTKGEPVEKLIALSTALLEAYRDADAEHKVQINDLKRLPAERQEDIKELERELVRLFSDALVAANPSLDHGSKALKPVTMSLFGMLNWHYLWFRPDGPISRQDYAAMATQLVVEGTKNLDLTNLKAIRPLSESKS